MKIAQIAPLYESVPPKLYGGTERIVSFLTEELVRQGHEVTLFASGDSVTAAELVPGSPVALRLDPQVRDGLPYHVTMLEAVRKRAREFDLLIGEIGDRQKAEFLGNALALVFPIDWPEPFGIVMIEAMACGTPVIAFDRGSVPEVIDDGVTGFVVDTVEQAAAAVLRAVALDRALVRATFERRFTAERMAGDYLALYRRLVAGGPVLRPARPAVPVLLSA